MGGCVCAAQPEACAASARARESPPLAKSGRDFLFFNTLKSCFSFSSPNAPSSLSHPHRHGGPQARRQGGRHVGRRAARRVRVRGHGGWRETRRGGMCCALASGRVPLPGRCVRHESGWTKEHVHGGEKAAWGARGAGPRVRARAAARASFPFLGANPPKPPPTHRPSTSTPSRRTSRPTSSASSTSGTRPRGTAWWGATLVRGGGMGKATGGRQTDTQRWTHTTHPPSLRLLCHARDQVLCLLLLGPPGGAAVQERVKEAGQMGGVFLCVSLFFHSPSFITCETLGALLLLFSLNYFTWGGGGTRALLHLFCSL